MKYEINYHKKEASWQGIRLECENPVIPRVGDEITINDATINLIISGTVKSVQHEISTWHQEHCIYVVLV